MSRTRLLSLVALALAAGATLAAAPAAVKWPPWLSIESPVNPFDPATRGAMLLVHAAFREGPAQLADLSGSAEGTVNGARHSVALHFDSTGRPNVFALRRQWPTEGTWVLRISLRTTTAIVTLGHAGEVASVSVPTQLSNGTAVPRAIGAKEIDSALAVAARR
ncbi:MAG: hypothetical protein ACREMU_10575 [Gemmatimonadaceae bacterium]